MIGHWIRKAGWPALIQINPGIAAAPTSARLAELSAGVCDANRRYLIAFDPRLKEPVCLSELHLIDEAQVIWHSGNSDRISF